MSRSDGGLGVIERSTCRRAAGRCFGTCRHPLKASGRVSVKAIGAAPSRSSVLGKPRRESRSEIARTARGCPSSMLSWVSKWLRDRSSVPANGMNAPGAAVQRPERIAHRRRQRPVRIQGQRAVVDAGRVWRWRSAVGFRSRSCSTREPGNWRSRSRRAGTRTGTAAPAGAANSRPAMPRCAARRRQSSAHEDV